MNNIPDEPKKRGRKPKLKTSDNDEPKIKRKRGRKRKYEMNLNNDAKISGFVQDIPTIDVSEQNKITYNQSIIDDNSEEYEKIKFGNGNTIFRKKKKPKHKINTLRKSFLSQEKIKLNENVSLEPSNPKGDPEVIPPEPLNEEECEIDTSFINEEEVIHTISLTNSLKTRKKDKIKKKWYENPPVRIFQKKGEDITEWKNKTNLLCWWCCHKFDTLPCFIPTNYNERQSRFKITGNFCSWNCAKSYKLYDTPIFRHGQDMHMFSYMLRKLKLPVNIKCAPRKECLAAFGGTLSIEEFREYSNSDEVNVVLLTSTMNPDENYRILRY